MKKRFSKGLSILLAFVMMLSLLPATALAADSRQVISNVVAQSPKGDITPKYGADVTEPILIVTGGDPAYFHSNTFQWYKKNDGKWDKVDMGSRFRKGTYRYEAQLRIDQAHEVEGMNGTTHVLASEGLTVTVDSKEWTVDKSQTGGTVVIGPEFSYVWVVSPEFNVTVPENQELTFYDSPTFDIGTNYVGRAITPYSVKDNVEGGKAPYKFSRDSGPAWIEVSAEGVISGTPTAVGVNDYLVVKVTDSDGAEKTITIAVANTVINSADREVVYTVKATGNIKPEYGKQVTNPTYTVTTGDPAYFQNNTQWYKKNGDTWDMIGTSQKFDEGTYRCTVQMRIDTNHQVNGMDGTTHVLASNQEGDPLTVTVDDKKWTVGENETPGGVIVGDTFSYAWVYSPEFEVTKPVIVALDVKGIKTPVAGETADTSGITINNGKGITVSEAQWKKGDLSPVDKFEVGKTYYLHIKYAVDDDYTVAERPKVLHDLTGGTANHNASVQTIMIAYTVPKTYTVTVTTDGNGTASASPAKAAAGTTVTLTATPNEDYEFDKWEIIEDRKEPFKLPGNSFTMPEHDVVVKATFKEKATVTTIGTINITGITAPAADKSPVTDGITTDTTGVTLKTIQWEKMGGDSMGSSEKFEVGQTYTLYISYEPQSGYEISNTVTVTSNLENSNVDATSDRVNIQYTVPEAATYTVAVTDGTARQVTPVDGEEATTIETKAGSRVLLKAAAKEGKVFTGWSGLDGIRLYGDGTTAKDDTLQFFMPEKNVEVKANYIDESSDKVIKNIKITGITTPLAGASPEVYGIKVNTERLRLTTTNWSYNGAYFGPDKTFEKDVKYCLYVFLELDEGYFVANDVTITADIDYDNAFVRDNVVYINYTVKEDAPASYTVTFEANGGSDTMADVSGVSGEYTLPECGFTAPADKQFKAWKVGGTEYAVGAKITVSANTTVTAVWEDVSTLTTIDTINVTGIIVPVAGETADVSTIIINNNNGITVNKARWYKAGSGNAMADSDTFVGGELYTLLIWYDLAEGYTVSSSAVFTHNLPDGFLEAHSSTSRIVQVRYKVPYTVTVTTEGSGTASANPAAAAEGETVELTATANSGYKFKEWEVVSVPDGTNVTITDGKFTMPAGAVTVKAVFEKDDTPVTKYTVSFDSDGGSAVTEQTIEAGQKATKPADPTKTDYVFKGWTLNGADYDFSTPVTGNIELVAKWEKVDTPVTKYTVTVVDGTGSGSYKAGDTVTIKADSKSGYTFDKWIVVSGDVTLEDKNDSATTFKMPEGDVEVKATYDKKSSGSSSSGGSTKYKVTAEDSENGSVTLSKTNAAKGTTVTITVDPEAGYEVEKVVVVTKSGKEVEVTDKGDGTFTFKMPAEAVSTEVTYKETVKEEADEAVSIVLTIDSVIAWVFDEYMANDVAPVIRNERTMLPARFIAEALGGVVTWDEAEQKVTIVNGEDTIEIFIGEPFATVNGNPVELDSPAFIENSRTYLPIRFIAENMGATVTWDADTRAVTITP